MLQKIFDAIKSLFAALFGGGKPEKKVEPPKKKPRPDKIVIKPQDGADIKPDTADVVEKNEADPVIVDPAVPDKEFDLEEEDPEEIPEEEKVEEKPEPAKNDKPATNHKPRYLWCLDNGHGKKTAGKRSPFFRRRSTAIQRIRIQPRHRGPHHQSPRRKGRRVLQRSAGSRDRRLPARAG